MSVEVGNLELLEQLMKSSTIDLVRRFNAKKLTIGNVEVYCLDVHHIPWITTIKLGSDVDILNTKILVDISFKDGDFKKVPIGVELTIGYLLQVRENLYNIVGITLVNRKPMFQLRKFKVELPLDLQVLPKFVTYPEIYAISREEIFREHVDIVIDKDQLKLLDTQSTSLKSNVIACFVNFVTFFGKFRVNVRVESI